MATIDTTRGGEALGNPSGDFDGALGRAEDGQATDEDRRRFLQAADFLHGLYDGSIQAVADGFDRDAILKALQVESPDPRDQAETIADVLARLGEGYDVEEGEMTVARSFFIQYEMLRLQSGRAWW